MTQKAMRRLRDVDRGVEHPAKERARLRHAAIIWVCCVKNYSIVRGEIDRHAALLGLTVPRGTLSAERLA